MLSISSIKRKKIPFVVYEAIFGFLSGILFSYARMGNIASPLHVAAASVLSPTGAVCILAGSCLSYVSSGILMDNLYILIALLAISVFKIIGNEKLNSSLCALLSGGCVLVGGVVSAFVTDLTLIDMLSFCISSFLASISAYFIHFVYDNLKKQKKIVLNSSVMCAYAVIYILVISALCNINIFYFNIGRITAIVITLIAAKKYRQTGGVICGSLSACAAMLCNVDCGMPVIFLPVAGFMTGFMHKFRNPVMTGTFIIINLFAQLAAGIDSTYYSYISDLAVGVFLYAGVHKICFERWLIAGEKKNNDLADLFECRMKTLAGSIGAARKDAEKVSNMLKNKNDRSSIITEISSCVCSECPSKAVCWTEKYENTKKAINTVFNKKYSVSTPVPKELENCLKKDILIEKIFSEKNKVQNDKLVSMKLEENRNALFKQLEATEKIIYETSKNMSVSFCNDITENICRILEKENINFSKVWAYYNNLKVLSIEIYAPNEKCLKSPEILRKTISSSLHMNFIMHQLIPTGNREEVVCFLHEEPFYELETWTIVHGTKKNDYICGDTAEVFFDGRGCQYLVISDGMGTGSEASLESRMASTLFEKLITGGMSCENSIKIINGLMYAKSENEIFTTFDVTKIDLYTCEIELMKSGAVSTLIKSNGDVRKIGVQTLPVGIMPETDIYLKKMKLKEGDMIVMLSDGINESEYRFIKQLLLNEKSIENIAKQIYEKSPIFNGGNENDDISIIAARLKKKNYKKK